MRAILTENCPCLNCLCVPVCRQKQYETLLKCTLVMDYLYLNNDNYTKRLHILCKAFFIEPVYVTWEAASKIISQRNTFGSLA